jgi:chromatin remodeling complex protein RSC6
MDLLIYAEIGAASMAGNDAENRRRTSFFRGKKGVAKRVQLARNKFMATKAPKKTPTKRKPNAAFLKPVTPDDKLAAVVGAKPLPRTEIVSKLWVYIKKNNLQDKKEKTKINADEVLKAVFDGKKQVTMFEMNKYVSGHLKA